MDNDKIYELEEILCECMELLERLEETTKETNDIIDNMIEKEG